MTLYQMDVKDAFLNGDLLEEVYMDPLPNFVVKGHEGKVCLLKKSLYELKQSPWAWCDRFSRTVIKFGF